MHRHVHPGEHGSRRLLVSNADYDCTDEIQTFPLAANTDPQASQQWGFHLPGRRLCETTYAGASLSSYYVTKMCDEISSGHRRQQRLSKCIAACRAPNLSLGVCSVVPRLCASEVSCAHQRNLS